MIRNLENSRDRKVAPGYGYGSKRRKKETVKCKIFLDLLSLWSTRNLELKNSRDGIVEAVKGKYYHSRNLEIQKL